MHRRLQAADDELRGCVLACDQPEGSGLCTWPVE